MNREPRFVLIGLCIGLGAVIIGEQVLSVSAVEASASDTAPAASLLDPSAVIDADRLVATIVARPLFTPDRRPPQPPPPPTAAAKTAPELKARLAGMIVEPGDREAIFARDGGGQIAVKERQEIDGWTVTAIEIDKVVLSSTFGDRVLQPMPMARPVRVVPRMPPSRRQNAGAQATAAANQPPRVPQPTTAGINATGARGPRS